MRSMPSLTTAHGGLLTIGAFLAIYFSSSGVEAFRVGLNRAYGVRERRTVVAAAARIDRLRAGGRGRAVGPGLPGRADAPLLGRPHLLGTGTGAARRPRHARPLRARFR